jgi:transcriptional regulator with XRE-family HTH domain
MTSKQKTRGPSAPERPPWAIRLTELRTAKGLSQSALAAAADLSQSAIADYERGRSTPNIRMMSRLALALGVPTTEFIVAADPVREKKLEEFRTYTDSLPDRGQGVFQDSAEFDNEFIVLFSKIITISSKIKSPSWRSLTANIYMTRRCWREVMSGDPNISMDVRMDQALASAERFYDLIDSAPFFEQDLSEAMPQTTAKSD